MSRNLTDTYDWGAALFALEYFDLHRFAVYCLYMLYTTEDYSYMTKQELFDAVREVDQKVGEANYKAFMDTIAKKPRSK